MRTMRLAATACLIGLLMLPVAGHSQELSRGTRLGEPRVQTAYRQTWALIIGVNYKGGLTDKSGRAQLPELKNAISDAQLLADTLRNYYCDTDNKSGYFDDAHLKVLLEEDATEENIVSEVARLCDSNVVKPEDSVLVYFAGHAVRLDANSRKYGDAVALLPHDAKLSTEGAAIVNTIGLPHGLVSRLKNSPARHKLLILDCCYSGEIFELPSVNVKDAIVFKDRLTEAPDRRDRALQNEDAFQAIASCRRTQTASDGSQKNSPFTSALVDGLQRLPARFPADPRVWANRLLFYIRPNPAFPETQKPDCRNLLGTDGEFCFYPSRKASFAKFMVSADEKILLQASVASRQGSWWFEEMPWFIPSIRAEILLPREKGRSAGLLEMIESREIRKLTETFLRTNHDEDRLMAMRARHAKSLLAAQSAGDYQKTLQAIHDELLLHYTPLDSMTERSTKSRDESQFILKATDIHLLAVLQHALREDEQSRLTYDDAIARYAAEARDEERPLLHILKALCEADLGELLLAAGNSSEEAAEQFRKARDTMRKVATDTRHTSSIFDIYVLCREANAWLSVNHWKKADACLLDALDEAKSLDLDHYLTAHVNRQRAWAEIIQWRLDEARRSFLQSNVILGRLFRKNLDPDASTQHQSEAVSVDDGKPTYADDDSKLHRNDSGSRFGEHSLVLPPEFYQSNDFASKIAYLHNLHGVAMAQRFQGDPLGAAKSYRELVGTVEATFSDFQARAVDGDLSDQYLMRIINTQERLGDCNLFGHPRDRDLKEAMDDYRRATHRVHWLRDHRARDRWNSMLLYKQALALSLRSSVQDTDLALEMSRRGDELYTKLQSPATGLHGALGLLTTHIVKLVHGVGPANSDSLTDQQANPSELRRAIRKFRDAVGSKPHRDELELCLFSSKVLLEHADEHNRHQTLEDADLLLSFCRIGLSPYLSDTGEKFAGTTRDSSNSRAYLRPYYDAVMRAKLSISRKNVTDLLEIQREATQGTYYIKTKEALPILATYVLDEECLLLFDLPRGESKCVSLSDMYDVGRIQQACYGPRLPLPRGVHDSLSQWWRAPSSPAEHYANWENNFCWWEDPMWGFVASGFAVDSPMTGTTMTGTTVVNRPITGGHFPFELHPPSKSSETPVSEKASVLGATTPKRAE